MNINVNLLDFLKLPTKIMAAIVVATSLFLFLPDSIMQKLYLLTFRVKYGYFVGPIFLLSISILTVSLTINIFEYLVSKRARKRFLAEGNGKLKRLDTYKKTIIYCLYVEDNHTGVLPLHDGAVKFLEYQLFIGKTATQYLVYDLNNATFPYMLQPWVINELDNDEDLRINFEEASKTQIDRENEKNYILGSNLFNNNNWL